MLGICSIACFPTRFNCVTVDSQGDVVVLGCCSSFANEQITGILDHLKCVVLL